MSLEANKEVARRFIDEVFGGDKSAVDELVAEDFVPHSWGPMPPGREALKQAIDRVYGGLSDHRMIIDDLIAEGDRVAIRLRSHARHTGTFMGIPATDREYEISETHVVRIRDGQVVEHWRDADMLGLMQQLGALKAPASATQREPAATR
jgi:predicted ester cyclase